MSIGICGSHSAFWCIPGAKCPRTIFQIRVHQYGCDKKCVGTSYTELEFSHPVASAGQVVHSGASGVRNIHALFFMLGWDQYRLHESALGQVMPNLCFCIRWDLWVT
jgi:hypothetical protein